MNPKHHTSLPIAKQLAEAGIVIESEFWWSQPIQNEWSISYRSYTKEINGVAREYYPAPIATELLERLPDGWRYGVNLVKLMSGYGVELTDYTPMPYKRLEFIQDKNPCDALALLLIRLTKDGIL